MYGLKLLNRGRGQGDAFENERIQAAKPEPDRGTGANDPLLNATLYSTNKAPTFEIYECATIDLEIAPLLQDASPVINHVVDNSGPAHLVRREEQMDANPGQQRCRSESASGQLLG